MTSLKTGDKVITLDGKELGHVKEVGNTCFKVNAPRRRDFWLPSAAVERRVAKTALLRFDKEHLTDAAIDVESHSGLHVHGDERRRLLMLPAGLFLLAPAVLVALMAKSRRGRAASGSSDPDAFVIQTASEEAEVRGAEAAAAEAKRQAEQVYERAEQ